MPSQKRTYTQSIRAQRTAATRTRIVEATASLHREQGPAATTVAEVARRAGVSRITVHAHFPADADLFAACQAHVMSERPAPDYAPALALADPVAAVRAALEILYADYAARAPLTAKVMHDRRALPALDELLARTRDRALNALRDALATGLRGRGTPTRRLRAALDVALDFFTWEHLDAAGLSAAQAAALMTELVDAAAGR